MVKIDGLVAMGGERLVERLVERVRARAAFLARRERGLVAMGGDAVGGVAVVVDYSPDGTARVVYERADGVLLAGDPSRGWDRADEEEVAAFHAAEPWNAH